MDNLMGLISLNDQPGQLAELTACRPLATVPVGGRYRMIDFVLSGMVNAGIANIGVLLPQNSRSVMDHLRSGKEWDLARKVDGLALLPYQSGGSNGSTQLTPLLANRDYLERSRQQHVLIAGADHIAHIDFHRAFLQHRQSGSHVTLVAHNSSGCCRYKTGETGGLRPLDIFVMDKHLLLDLTEECLAQGLSLCEAITGHLKELKTAVYEHKGYTATIDCLSSYFRRNMELLQQPVWDEVFRRSGLIHTKVKDEPPARYALGAKVKNSLIAGGCVIEGIVENSILFRGVRIAPHAVVRNSILFQDTVIDQNAFLYYAICDKNVTISAGRSLAGSPAQPVITGKGRMV